MKNSYGELEENIFFKGHKIILQCDCNGKIKIENLCETDSEGICKFGAIVAKLNSMPMSKDKRKACIERVKDICYTLELDEDLAVKNARCLERSVEKNLQLKKRIQYVSSVVLLFIILIIIALIIFDKYKEISYVFLCSSLGGILAVLYKQNSLEIDYAVEGYVIILEGIKRVILTIVVATIGFIVVKANIVLPNFDVIADDYTLSLVMIVCGYSINFIPNILDKVVLINDVEEKNDV